MNKKILVVADRLPMDGEKRLADLIRMERERFEFTVITPYFYSEFHKFYPEDVEYLHSRIKTPGGDSRLKRLIKKCLMAYFLCTVKYRVRKEKFDVLLALENGSLARKLAGAGIPRRYAWVHRDYGFDAERYYISTVSERASLSGYTGVICPSEELAQQIRDVLGNPCNLIVLPDPVDADDLRERAEETVVEVAVKPTVPRFTAVGSLQERHGYDLLLEACHMLEQDGEQFEVLIIGREENNDGTYTRLRAVQERENVQSVKILGARRNPYKYLLRSDWLISSAISEGDLMPVHEAAALGIPAVLTDCTGVGSLLGDNRYGIVIRDISVCGIYETMKHILHNPKLNDRYRGKLKEPDDFAVRMQALEDLLDQ